MVNRPFYNYTRIYFHSLYNMTALLSFILLSYLQDWMGFYLKASCNNFAMWTRSKRIKNKMKMKWNYNVSMLFT